MGNLTHRSLTSTGREKKIATEGVISCLKNICTISNSNLVCNSDGLLSKRKKDVPVDWIGASKVIAPPEKFKVSY